MSLALSSVRWRVTACEEVSISERKATPFLSSSPESFFSFISLAFLVGGKSKSQYWASGVGVLPMDATWGGGLSVPEVFPLLVELFPPYIRDRHTGYACSPRSRVPMHTFPGGGKGFHFKCDPSELLPILAAQIAGSQVNAVNARDLHQSLGSKDEFSCWISDQVKRARLYENRDFEVSREIPGNPRGGRPRTEYALTLDAAKHIAMMAGTNKDFDFQEHRDLGFYSNFSNTSNQQLTPSKGYALTLDRAKELAMVERRALETLADGGEPRASTLAIAQGTENEHASVILLARKYVDDLKEFGRVVFKSTRPVSGGHASKYAHTRRNQTHCYECAATLKAETVAGSEIPSTGANFRIASALAVGARWP